MLVRKGRRQKTKPLKVLLDSGTSATIVNKKFCEKYLRSYFFPVILGRTAGPQNNSLLYQDIFISSFIAMIIFCTASIQF